MSFYQIVFIFFCYSFLGWVLETGTAAVRQRRYVTARPLGPLCAVYGVAGVVITAGLQELRGNWLFLFLGSAIYATVVEWIAGHLLERITHTRWWDYLRPPVEPGRLYLCERLRPVGRFRGWPQSSGAIRCWCGSTVCCLAWSARFLSGCCWVCWLSTRSAPPWPLSGTVHSCPRWRPSETGWKRWPCRWGTGLWGGPSGESSAPTRGPIRPGGKKEKSTVFAQGCSFYKIVPLFFIGAFWGYH